MDTGIGRAARRELAVVLVLAFCGVVLALLVAFVPWYEPMVAGGTGAAVGETIQPVGVPDLTGVGAAVLVERR
jgi:hypothetical protein